MKLNKLYKKAEQNYKSKKYDDAIIICNEILQYDNLNKKVWNLLGIVFLDLKQYEIAKKYFETAFNIDNMYGIALFNLGNVYLEQNDLENAAQTWLNSIPLLPKFPDLYNNLGVVCVKLNLIEESIKYYKKAVELDHTNINALSNLAKNYLTLNDLNNSLYYCEKALKLNKNLAYVNFDKSLIYLLQHNYKNGWKYYEYRMQIKGEQHKYNYLPFTIWKNENLLNKSLFIYHEQGFGDTIQFSRYLNMLKNNKINFSVGIQNSLNKLLSFNFPNIQFISKLENDMIFDYSLPIMSIPYKFNINKIKPIKKYLNVRQSDISKFSNKYINKDTFNIGIVWQGSKTHNKDKIRSTSLKYFKELLNIQNITLYSLQVENNEEIKSTKIINLGQYFKDFYDTAVAIESLDLVISIDTSIIHLAGSLGKECWVLIPFHPDWRWGLNSSTNNWYKSVTLFRQSQLNSWDSAFSDIYTNLASKVKNIYE